MWGPVRVRALQHGVGGAGGRREGGQGAVEGDIIVIVIGEDIFTVLRMIRETEAEACRETDGEISTPTLLPRR